MYYQSICTTSPLSKQQVCSEDDLDALWRVLIRALSENRCLVNQQAANSVSRRNHRETELGIIIGLHYRASQVTVSSRVVLGHQIISNLPLSFVILSSSLTWLRAQPPLPSPSSASKTLPPSTSLTSLELGLKLPPLAHLKLPFVFVKHAFKSMRLPVMAVNITAVRNERAPVVF